MRLQLRRRNAHAPAACSAIDEDAPMAASIGQVHRARLSDGRPVAVKVQYPGIATALRSDMRVVSAMTRAAATVAAGLALPPLVTEMRTRLAEELYDLAEADTQRRFAAAYRDEPDVVIPDVLIATPRVLVTEWLDATPFVEVAARGTQQQRDRSVHAVLLSGPACAGLLHTDPHPATTG